MIIRRLKVLNVKRLRDATFVPPDDASLVVLAGRNDNGKSSALDSICMVLGGAKFDPPQPIHRGEEKAIAEVDLGQLRARCIWTAKGRYLEVVDKADPKGKISSPQNFLDRLVGDLAFDPLAFSRAPASDQVKILADLLGIDFAQANEVRAEKVVERTAAQRAWKAAEKKAEELGETIHDFTIKETSISDLVSLIQAGTLKNQHKAGLKQTAEQAEKAIQEADEKVRRLQQEIEEATAALRVRETEKDQATRLHDAAPEFDVSALQVQLVSAEIVNAEARKVAEYNALVAAVESASSEFEKAGAKIAKIDAWKKKQLAEASFPVTGLAFAEDGTGVLLNDLPFEQAGDASKIKVGVAIGLAMSKEIKVLLIRDGSLLDDDSMDAIEAMAKEAGAQVWVERVSAEGPCTWRIVDGSIEADDEATP